MGKWVLVALSLVVLAAPWVTALSGPLPDDPEAVGRIFGRLLSPIIFATIGWVAVAGLIRIARAGRPPLLSPLIIVVAAFLWIVIAFASAGAGLAAPAPEGYLRPIEAYAYRELTPEQEKALRESSGDPEAFESQRLAYRTIVQDDAPVGFLLVSSAATSERDRVLAGFLEGVTDSGARADRSWRVSGREIQVLTGSGGSIHVWPDGANFVVAVTAADRPTAEDIVTKLIAAQED